MKKSVFAAFIAVLLSSCAGSVAPAPQNETSFDPCGRNLCVGLGSGAPSSALKFFIKGMVYSPTPIGAVPFDSPLKDSNAAIWGRDLQLMRAMGVNAIHVYSVTPPPYDEGTGPIFNFLNAAWNGNDHPIYVLMSIFFERKALDNIDATRDLAKQYHDLDQKYASSPAVLGVIIGNELGMDSFNDAQWNNFNTIARAAKQGFVDGGDGSKIVTTSEPDGNIGAITAGEAHGAAVDVWGINIYRGRTLTNLFAQIRANTHKPVFFTEWGAPASYHPGMGNTYTYGTGPTDLGACTQGSGPLLKNDVAAMTTSTTPNIAGLSDLIANNVAAQFAGYTADGVVSGGFFFEWTDEWWKANAGDPNTHYGNTVFNGAFPGCTNDEGWYGLNAVFKNGGGPDTLVARPSLDALKNAWAAIP